MRRQLIHCSYHKCLTAYFGSVLFGVYNVVFLRTMGGYKHFNSRIDSFYKQLDKYRVVSVNNHSIEADKLGNNFRISRFMRDPRDLVVSGYFYHKRGGEAWCRVVDPTERDWNVVNGSVPPDMPEGHSFMSYLQSLGEEEGLKAEIDFRKKHFESMLQWPLSDPRIRLFYYEDILGNEARIFDELLRHYEVSAFEHRIGKWLAAYYSAEKQNGRSTHIRNPQPGQWRYHFTPEVEIYFNEKYGGLLEKYGYK
ncbi:MAG TPA: sulfotransferase domain-containing protein [Balneolaceae bacterium]|nr:sulfotransferase domain-containing protein [Balneolaceae bacterium]